MHVGLITGLGPAASMVYYQRLTKIAADRGCRLELTMVEANIREVLANNLAGRTQEQAEIFAVLLHRLKAAGADFASITAIGPLFCWEETRALSPLPLLSAVTPLDRYCAEQGFSQVGLLGTARAMRTKLFGQMVRTEVLLPDNLEPVGEAYQNVTIQPLCGGGDRIAGKSTT
jgi:aspartate racemase